MSCFKKNDDSQEKELFRAGLDRIKKDFNILRQVQTFYKLKSCIDVLITSQEITKRKKLISDIKKNFAYSVCLHHDDDLEQQMNETTIMKFLNRNEIN